MKKNYLRKKLLFHFFTITALFFIQKINAQCPTGNVELFSQAAINQFAIDYSNCTQIQGNLTIRGADITNLQPLSNITHVVGYLNISQNSLLQNCFGLENLTSTGYSIEVSSNPQMTNVNGLSGLTNIGTDIFFNNNVQLQNISALSGITSTGGGIWITSNPQLLTFDGLQNITQIQGDIYIQSNATLNDISALQNILSTTIIMHEGDGLTILNNPALAVCNLPNFCAYLGNPTNTHPRVISGNLLNCLNEGSVIAACSTLSTENNSLNDFVMFPNPVKEVLHFSEELQNIIITDISGREVKKIQNKNKSINLTDLSKGVYLIFATNANGKTIVKRIIKE